MDSKQKGQIAFLVVMLCVVGWLAYDVLVPSSPTQPSRSNSISIEKSDQNKNIIVQTVEVEQELPAPEKVKIVSLPELTDADSELLELSKRSQLLEARVATQRLKNEYEKLRLEEREYQEMALSNALDQVTLSLPSVQVQDVTNGNMPTAVEPLLVAPEEPLQDYASGGNEPSGAPSNDHQVDVDKLFDSLKVTSVVSTNETIYAWLELGNRRIRAVEGLEVGGLLVQKIEPTHIVVGHAEQKVSRRIYVGFTPSSPAPAAVSTPATPEPTYDFFY